ncbi:MAG TPA: hypothetical protein VE954_22190 [Oligoflexus sp.]|uniref:hypothetical protein n=1 Tax=Oligoflexus sp. TaxID=1971216 RepID=UPI002D34BA85|nr:hypothetical protein [Oligoflexus sp.]HYX35818.1 hypothetical protein [Oligoflexus sp.]
MTKRDKAPDMKEVFHYEFQILPWKEQYEQFIRSYIGFVLANLNGNISAAIRVLTMNRPHLYCQIKRFGLERVKIKKANVHDLSEISDEDLLKMLKPDEIRALGDRVHKIVEGLTTKTACERLEGNH